MGAIKRLIRAYMDFLEIMKDAENEKRRER